MKLGPVDNNSSSHDSTQLSFEAAFARLEEILEKLNSGAISLDESLRLYEEADRLVAVCSRRLNEAERKIEILVKNRNGELVIDGEDRPVTQEYKTVLSN